MRALSDIEARIFSQNGEDGIIGNLFAAVDIDREFFLEIGCGNGKQNNTSMLAEVGWRGLGIDQKPARVAAYNERALARGWQSVAICEHVTCNFARQLARAISDVAVFSIDIDSTDWHIVKAMVDAGFRPTIIVAEYNAAFEHRPLSVPYSDRFKSRFKHFYFGAGLQAWRLLLEPAGYRFVTVDSSGVNAFFVREDAVVTDLLDQVEWLEFADNRHHAAEFGPARKRFKRLTGLHLDDVRLT